jgi:glycosyltransferase involved in cell wall biosynthesis
MVHGAIARSWLSAGPLRRPTDAHPVRVLQVVTDDNRRGAQVFARDLHRALCDLGMDLRTVALGPGRVGGLDVDVLGPTKRDPRTLRRLRSVLANCDVVVGHGSTTLPACALVGLGTGVPFVYRQISDSLFWANTAARRARVRAALRRSERVVALWHGAARILTDHFGVAADRIDCIPNGVPVNSFPFADDAARRRARHELGIEPSRVVVACVGALVAEKGVDLAIDVALSDPALTLLVAGDGDQRDALVRRAAANRRVRFLGSVPDPGAVYAAADVVVLPSRGGDSMPATLIEAGLRGRPVISTAVAAIPEIVVDGQTGVVVSPWDGRAFAAAVHNLASNATRRASLGAAARQHCERRFSIDVVARQWAATLTRAVQPPPAPPGRRPRIPGGGHVMTRPETMVTRTRRQRGDAEK